MDTYFDANILTGTGLLAPDVNHKKIRAFLQEQIKPVRELMAYYQCAMMEVETKFKVLSQELSLEYDRNPIETIKTRLKSMDSITDKLLDRGFSLTLENIEQQLNDVAGVRVICGLPSDIYELADAFLRQDDVRLIMKKDYIANPKENGYRSLHLIVEIPIFLHDEKKMMKVEVQLRTISMDWWASLEHKIRYKKESQQPHWTCEWSSYKSTSEQKQWQNKVLEGRDLQITSL